MEIRIDHGDLMRLAKILDKNYSEFLKEFLNERALNLEQQASLFLQQRIYAMPPSKYYTRTGSAGRGHDVDEIEGGYQVFFSSVSGGADREYSPFLNKNRRVGRLNTYFFTDAVENEIKNIGDELEKKLNKVINQ